jgi:hypothetical protein
MAEEKIGAKRTETETRSGGGSKLLKKHDFQKTRSRLRVTGLLQAATPILRHPKEPLLLAIQFVFFQGLIVQEAL